MDSGSVWEPIGGYSRAVRDGNRIAVSGTTATHGSAGVIALDDAGAQTTYIIDKIAASLRSVGGSLDDVIRTRVYLSDVNDWEAVARAHGRAFGGILPANTMLQVGALIGAVYRVEIEAEGGGGQRALMDLTGPTVATPAKAGIRGSHRGKSRHP